MTRHGDWMSTYSGGIFWPCDPRPEEIRVEDVAHHLAHICRFTGAVEWFCSVAQHSVLCSEIVPEEDAKWGLLHDCSEAYLAGVSRPVKPHLQNYKELEDRLMRCVAKRFRLPWPMPMSVHVADDVLVCTERRDLMRPGRDWGEGSHKVKLLLQRIEPMMPAAAERLFLRRYRQLFPEELP